MWWQCLAWLTGLIQTTYHDEFHLLKQCIVTHRWIEQYFPIWRLHYHGISICKGEEYRKIYRKLQTHGNLSLRCRLLGPHLSAGTVQPTTSCPAQNFRIRSRRNATKLELGHHAGEWTWNLWQRERGSSCCNAQLNLGLLSWTTWNEEFCTALIETVNIANAFNGHFPRHTILSLMTVTFSQLATFSSFQLKPKSEEMLPLVSIEKVLLATTAFVTNSFSTVQPTQMLTIS